MLNYAEVVMLLSFTVEYLLLFGTNSLCGFPTNWKRTVLAATVGSAYTGMCLLPGITFLGRPLLRGISLCGICLIAYGVSKTAFRKTAVFVLLRMALGGVVAVLGKGGLWSVLVGALGISVICIIGFRDKIGRVSYVPVELNYGGKRVMLTALQDTGNTLCDPVTGRPVLIIDAQTAGLLTGLTEYQLSEPVHTMTKSGLAGLRLIPYHGVGQSDGLLLAVRMYNVRIGKWRGSSLVAFAPGILSREGAYQALTGGSYGV